MYQAFGLDSRTRIQHLLCDPSLPTKAKILQINASKKIHSEILFERNQKILDDKFLDWEVCFELIKIKVSYWRSLFRFSRAIHFLMFAPIGGLICTLVLLFSTLLLLSSFFVYSL